MNYELARELEQAGFPYDENRAYLQVQPFEQFYPRVRIPTLSEIIEACMGFYRQREIFTMTYGFRGNEWQAAVETHSQGMGKTPEEAVAKLWLALNTKNEPNSNLS